MTSPETATTTNDGRTYVDPTGDPDRQFVSVTTAIGRGLPKSLDNWFKKLTAEFALEHAESLLPYMGAEAQLVEGEE